jgi:hypothetical protein
MRHLLHLEVTKNGFRILFQELESKGDLENRAVCYQPHRIVTQTFRKADGLNLIDLALDGDQC